VRLSSTRLIAFIRFQIKKHLTHVIAGTAAGKGFRRFKRLLQFIHISPQLIRQALFRRKFLDQLCLAIK
jgi:RsiW-degrading membrane proteinase PrsW (M82 family)